MVRHYLVEIPVPESSELEVERALGTLRAAESRLGRTSDAPRVLATGMASDEGRLLCLIEASGTSAVRRLVALGLLPEARIREVTQATPPVA